MNKVETDAVICREIVDTDLERVAALLTAGFAGQRVAAFWTRALARLAARTPPPGFPRFGYVLALGERLVGVLLLLAAEVGEGGARHVRCNVSSWWVEPGFRPYGSLLVHRALRRREATYLNVTPAPETWTLLEAQGYQRYASGRAVACPVFARAGRPATVRLADPGLQPGPDLSAGEVQILREHAAWDCLSVVCDAGAGRVPFVFGRRRLRGALPFAYLIYSRDLDSLTAHARPLGRFLLRRGIPLLVTDADGRLPGMPGWFVGGHPKFFRGPNRPRPGDLAYTERAVFGV